MDPLSDNIEKIREIGISYGLSDKAIDECLLRAVINCRKKPVNLTTKRRTTKCRALCYICLIPFLILIAVYTLASLHKPTDMFLGKHLANVSYPLFRGIRLATLPLSRKLDLSVFHDLQCLLRNPLFMDPPIECEPCMSITKIKTVQQEEAIRKSELYLGEAQPLLITNGFEETVCFDQLKQLYLAHEDKFIGAKHPLYSTIPSVQDAGVFFKNFTERKLLSNPSFHAEWYPSKVNQVQVIRKLFKRPTFVPAESEIAIEKAIFIDGPKSKPYPVIRGHYAHTYYLQTSGQRRLVLVPNTYCIEDCKSLNFIVKERQMVYFHDAYWNLESIPVLGVNAPDELSIGYMATFT